MSKAEEAAFMRGTLIAAALAADIDRDAALNIMKCNGIRNADDVRRHVADSQLDPFDANRCIAAIEGRA